MMGDYTVTLTASQEDALTALAAQQAKPPRVIVQDLVNTMLYTTERSIEAALQQLDAAGQALPDVLRARMTAGLAGEQLVRLRHLRPPPDAPGRERDQERGPRPR
jgi:hypothetical protein